MISAESDRCRPTCVVPRVTQVEKVDFTMIVPQVRAKLNEEKITDVILLGLETHVCVQQTT